MRYPGQTRNPCLVPVLKTSQICCYKLQANMHHIVLLIESCGPAAVWEPPGRSPLPLAGPPAGPWALQPAPAASKTPAAPPATAHRVIHTLHPLIPVSFTSQKIWDSEVQYQSQRLS